MRRSGIKFVDENTGHPKLHRSILRRPILISALSLNSRFVRLI